jgi:hypothetical protein
MVLVDFHKYGLKPAKRAKSVAAAKAEIMLTISIKRTALSIGFNRRAGGIQGTARADACVSTSVS